MATKTKVVALKTSPNKQARISEKTLRGIRRRQSPWYIRDTELIGFQIKVNPSGRHVYRVEARLGGSGRVLHYNIGPTSSLTAKAARAEACDALQLIRKGIDPKVEKRKNRAQGMTLQELLDEFLEHRDLKPRTRDAYRNLIERLCRKWLSRPVTDISSDDIKEWYIAGSKSPAQTDGAFRSLKSILSYAVALEILEVNPSNKVTELKLRYRKVERCSYLDLEYDLPKFLRSLLDISNQEKGIRQSQLTAIDYILFLLTTGLRASEGKNIQWTDIDWERKVVTIRDTKNRRTHLVPMAPLQYSMLQKRESEWKKESKYVFPNRGKTGPITDVRKTMSQICDSAGIAKITLHDLRRTFATILNDIGVGFADTKALMNHSRDDITLSYIQTNREKLRGHLIKVVHFCDHHTPLETPKEFEDHAEGTLRLELYGKGHLRFFDRDHPKSFDEYSDREYWEG